MAVFQSRDFVTWANSYRCKHPQQRIVDGRFMVPAFLVTAGTPGAIPTQDAIGGKNAEPR
jgi:hypothetical protein